MKLSPETHSYMQLCLHSEGRTLYLMVPTFYDRSKNRFVSYVQLPKAKKTLMVIGNDSKDLEHNFNAELAKSFETDPDETFDLFKPLSYWNEMMESDEL